MRRLRSIATDLLAYYSRPTVDESPLPLPRWLLVSTVFAVIAGAIIAALGGFEAAPRTGPPTVRLGVPVSLGPLDLTIHGAACVPESTSPLSAEPTRLLIRTTVLVRGDRPLRNVELRAALTSKPLPSKPDRVATELLRGDDDEVLDALNPGITSTVTYSWNVPAGWIPPRAISLGVHELRLDRPTSQGAEGSWIRGSSITTVSVPIPAGCRTS